MPLRFPFPASKLLHLVQDATYIAPRPGPAVVVSAGKMQKAVKVRQVKEVWNKHIRKTFYTNHNFLVSDPNCSLMEGDIITTTPERHSKWVKHTVASIIAPFGKAIEDRPPLFTPEQRQQMADTKRRAKVHRRVSRGVESAIKEVRYRGWEVKTATTGGWGALYDQAKSEGGAPEAERPKDALGRSVLPGGLHKFGGKGEGGINKEAMHGANRTLDRYEKAKEHEAEGEEVETRPAEEVAKENLEEKR